MADKSKTALSEEGAEFLAGKINENTEKINNLELQITVDDALSETSLNPVQNRVLHGIFESQRQVMQSMQSGIEANTTAISDRYTKTETDGKIAEAMTDVDNEHFHPVTVLPDPADAKENHEYILIEYEQDGTTIKSETHYLFYGGEYHEKKTTVSLDGYATEQYVDDEAYSRANAFINNNNITLNTREGQTTSAVKLSVTQNTAGELDFTATDIEYAELFKKTVYQKAKVDALLDDKQDKITGGTPGSVLIKASDTDGDFEWRQLGKDNMIYDVLWENPTPNTWVNPVLSRSAREYDMILFEARQQDGKWGQSFLNVADLGIGEEKELLINGYSWITIKFTDDTHIVGVNGTSSATVVAQKITGIVFSRLDGTIGRWEKIGEWLEGGVPKDYAVDLSGYSVLSFAVLRNDYGWYNTALISTEDFAVGQKIMVMGGATEMTVERIDATTIRRSYTDGNVGVGLRLYGYKEAAISDTDVQRIAEQVPGGGETPTLDAVLKKGNETEHSARFTGTDSETEISDSGAYMTGIGTEGMRQFSIGQNGISAVDNLVGTITPKFVVPFEPSGENQVAMSDAVKESFKKALGIANDAFVFDVDSDQFTEDADNPDGKHYGMTITSPTYDELLAMLRADKFVYARLLYNSGNAYEIMQLFHNNNSIYGRYFDVEFPQNRLMFASAYVNKRNNDTYFGAYQDYIGAGGSIDVDTAMSDTSENAVQNKVIKEYVDNIQGLPSGGANGQILARNSMSPDNSEWIDNPIGTHFEVGAEKWYGTYTANGVTYQVYSKLLDIGPLPSAAGATQYPHGITGIYQILQISGFTNDGFVMNAPRQNAQDNISIYQAQKSGNIVVEVGKDRSGKTGFVMLIYAKNN